MEFIESTDEKYKISARRIFLITKTRAKFLVFRCDGCVEKSKFTARRSGQTKLCAAVGLNCANVGFVCVSVNGSEIKLQRAVGGA